MPIKIKEQSPWKSQVLVIKALFKRELITRFGKYKLGAVWILLDPLLSVLFLGLILGPFLGRSQGEIPYIFFLLCGFMLLKMVTGPLTAGVAHISSTKGCLFSKRFSLSTPSLPAFCFNYSPLTLPCLFFVSLPTG